MTSDARLALPYALDRMNPVTGSPVDLAMAGMLLREARRVGGSFEHRAMQRMIIIRRAKYRQEILARQRSWQTKVSRRPQRGRHHDSWTIREGYVRCTAGGRMNGKEYPAIY